MKSLNIEEYNQFQEQGYLIIRGAFSQSELIDLRKAANNVRNKAETELPRGLRLWHEDQSVSGLKEIPKSEWKEYSWGVNEITRPDYFDPILINALAHENVDRVMSGLLDCPRAWGLKLLWAPRKSHYQLQWHRDCPNHWGKLLSYKPAGNDHVQFNAALEHDESFIVLPGTARRELTESETVAVQAEEWTAEVPGQIRAVLEPGDIVFMEAHSWHRGEAEPGAPRLSLHFSCQAQWVPLFPWGEKEHFDWICSEAFINQLDPKVQPYYERLKRATYSRDSYGWLREHAAVLGYEEALTLQRKQNVMM